MAEPTDTTPTPLPPPSVHAQPAFRILGQEFFYPTNNSGAISLCFASAAACLALAIIYIWANPRAYEHVERVLKAGNINAITDPHPTSEVITGGRFDFWAPSPNTYVSEEPPADRKWQKGIASERIAQFETKLDQFCTGWRRTTVFGKGTANAKEGYWYSMTVRPGFNEDSFADAYRQFWQSTSPVFTERAATKAEYNAPKK